MSMIHEYYSTVQRRYRLISEREIIPHPFYHAGKRLGDIVVSDVGISLVIWDYGKLDDGSGGGDYIFFDKFYKVVGSIYDPGGKGIENYE